MTKKNLLGATALRSAAIGVAFAFTAPAYAQETPEAPAQDDCSTIQDPAQRATCVQASTTGPAVEPSDAPTTGEGIVVTGSRIRRPNLESTTPITTFSGDQIYSQADHNLGEALNELPALRSTFAQSNPGLGIGVAGLNLLDLRGLGVQRTLVLVDGRRHVPSDIQNTASAVDINSIPTDLVERVDIVTGGNSAVYGSDAVAGVVNFILKKDFDDIVVRGGGGIPGYGAGANYFLSGVAGRNFADGRGNVAVSLEYTRQKRVFASDVPWRRRTDGFVTIDSDGAERFDGIPDAVFMRDLRNTTITRTGLVSFIQNPGTGCGGDTIFGEPFNCDYIFQPDGSLVPVTFDARFGTSTFGTYVGGNSETGNEGRQVSVYPSMKRYVANLIGHYDFSDAFKVFVEAKYARARSVGSNSGAAFDQGQFITFLDPRSQFRLDNPFLQPAARQTITDQLLATGNNNALINIFGPLSPADLAAIADGSYRFEMAKSFDDLGIRDEDALRETYRVVVGARGDITPHWSYEVSANYGRANEKIKILGNVNIQRLMLAMDAGVDPADGQIKCRAQFDPASAFASPDVDAVNGPGTLAADIAACVPYNPFGFPDNEAARQFITSNAGDHGYLKQLDFTAFVSGDTTGLLELPGGPIALALGVEYRKENAYFKADDEINLGLTFLNSLQTFDPSPSKVKEAFGEINIPILKDRSFFEELSVSGAARVSDYNNAAGTVWAYNFGGRWSPVRDIVFRANKGRAIRAPNYTETAAPLAQNFAPGFEDPCATARLSEGTSTRATNCQTDLGANLNDPGFQQKVAGVYSLEILSGSNSSLTEETSDSFTAGVVVQPRWVPGLAVTVDYYNIKVGKVIASPTAQDIVNGCYDLPDLNNQFCALFDRFAGPGVGPNGEQPGEILVQSLEQTPLNFAKRTRRGIDVDVSYRHRLAPKTFLNGRLYYTRVLESSNFQDPGNPDFEDRILGELGDPKNEAVLDLDLTLDSLTLGYGAHYIGRMYNGNYEDYNPLNGDPALNPDQFDITRYHDVLYHDLRVAWRVGGVEGNRPFEFYVGVDNVFDTHPPLDLSGLGAGSAIYDPWGRKFYGGFRASF